MESHDNFAYLLPFIFFVFGGTFLFLERWGSASSRYWGFGYIGAALGFASPLILTGLPFPIQAMVSNAFSWLRSSATGMPFSPASGSRLWLSSV